MNSNITHITFKALKKVIGIMVMTLFMAASPFVKGNAEGGQCLRTEVDIEISEHTSPEKFMATNPAYQLLSLFAEVSDNEEEEDEDEDKVRHLGSLIASTEHSSNTVNHHKEYHHSGLQTERQTPCYIRYCSLKIPC